MPPNGPDRGTRHTAVQGAQKWPATWRAPLAILVGRAGVEPKSVTMASASTCGTSADPCGAKSGAFAPESAPDGPSGPPSDTLPDPDLQAVIPAWSSLPPAVRARIHAMVQAADPGRE